MIPNFVLYFFEFSKFKALFNCTNNLSISFLLSSANKDDENKKKTKMKEIFFTYLEIGVAPVSKLTIFPSLYL